MKFNFWRKTPLSERPPEVPFPGQAGSMTLMSVFVYFLISTLGLGLIALSQTYRSWSVYKKDAVLLSTAAENGVRAGFDTVSSALAARGFPLPLTDEQYSELRAATLAGGAEMVEAILGRVPPLKIQDSAGALAWSADIGFAAGRMSDRETFITAAYLGTIAAQGRLARRPRSKTAGLAFELSAAAGRVPLSSFPFLIAGDDGPEHAADLIADRRVVLTPPEGRRVPLPPAATTLSLIPRDASPHLAETLKIKIFSPDRLSIFELRQALGLPLVNEPVPNGVYLVVNDTGLGGVFIQGDAEEIVLAAGSGRQYFQFRLAEGTWRLWFQPSEFRTEFTSPTETRTFDRIPLAIIMVNGAIASLGGGTVDETGVLSLTDRTDIPSVLDGVSLTIVSADEITISSHLIQEGVRWKDGIPYLKDSRAQLFLFASGTNFIDGSEKSGRIRIGAGGPADLILQAELTARDGLRIDGDRRDVTVYGGIQTSSLDPGSGFLKITPDARLLSPLREPGRSPRTTTPILWVTGLEALQWNDR